MADLCKHCQRPESEHHRFEARRVKLPNGCVCNRGVHSNGVLRPVCNGFKRSRSATWCLICFHDRACHAPKD